MRTRPRKGLRRPLAWAVLLGAILPGIAEAQLFPNLPLHKRKRHLCEQEDPVFKLYRYEYYGFHPTCWRRFPAGWGCPSPEQPNSAQAIKDIEEELKKSTAAAPAALPNNDLPAGGEADPGMGAPPGDSSFPSLPSGRSPFETDTGPGTPLGPTTTPRLAPREAPDADPALPLTPPATTTPNPSGADRATPPQAEAAPAFPAGPSAGSLALLDVGEVPNPGLPGSAPAPTTTAAPVPAAALPGVAPTAADPSPLQAPQRRGLLSGLFQGMGWRRR